MKNILFPIFIFSFFSLMAQSNCGSGRYYSEVFSSTQSTTNIKFGESDPYGFISNQELYLDIIEPVGDTLEKRPLVLHQFGGGFLIGWRTEPVIPQMGEMYAKRGFVFATIDYRLGFNPLDGQSAERAVYRAAQDLAASMRFLVDNADTYGIDTSAIFLTGTSAGCLSAFVTTFMKESDRADIPSTYGIPLEPTDLGCAYCNGNNNFNNQKVKVHGIVNNWGAILDTSYIDLLDDPEDNVPVISFHGTDDIIVPYIEGNPFSLPIFPAVQGSYLIHQRLENLGIKNKLFPLQGLGHEPQLLQLQTWVTDTIISQGSQFLYEIMYGDSLEISGDNTACINDINTYTLPLHANSQYCWDVTGGNIISINGNQIVIEWNAVGNYTLTGYELDRREISKKSELSISVEMEPTVFIDYSSYDGLFDFNSNSMVNLYSWNFGDGNTLNGPSVSHQYSDTGMFTVTLEIENDYCSNSKDTIVTSTLCPNADFEFTQNDSTFTFTDNSSFGSSVIWITSDGTILPDYSFDIDFTMEGTYTFTLISLNDFCSDTITRQVNVHFCSEALFDYVSDDLDYEFNNLSYNAFFYNWDFGDGSVSALENPNHSYLSPGNYDVTLITNSVNSCSDTTVKTIQVDISNSIHNSKLEQILIYPNPAQNEFSLRGISKFQNIEYTILSLSGTTIKTGLVNGETISVQKLATGVYYLKLSSKQYNFYQKLIVR